MPVAAGDPVRDTQLPRRTRTPNSRAAPKSTCILSTLISPGHRERAIGARLRPRRAEFIPAIPPRTDHRQSDGRDGEAPSR